MILCLWSIAICILEEVEQDLVDPLLSDSPSLKDFQLKYQSKEYGQAQKLFCDLLDTLLL